MSPTEPQEPTLQLAEILSDLTTLRLCDPAAALSLVSVRPSNSTSSGQAPQDGNRDSDLKRARELVELHYTVIVAQRKGELGRKLAEAREEVRRAIG